MATKQELIDQIAALKSAGLTKEAQKKEKELQAMESKGKTVPAPSSSGFSMSEDDWNKAQSKFATPGLHLSEFGMPDWDTQGKSIKFPFTVTEEGTSNDGIEAKISTGISPASAGILKRYLLNMGIAVDFPITLEKIQSWVPGKRAMTLWTKQVDKRTPEQGGKGTEYTKAVDIQPVGSDEPSSLGIGE